MSSPKPFIEQQLARKADLTQRIEMMRNHLAGQSEDVVGSDEDHLDVTERDIKAHEAEIADIDASIARMTDGHA